MFCRIINLSSYYLFFILISSLTVWAEDIEEINRKDIINIAAFNWQTTHHPFDELKYYDHEEKMHTVEELEDKLSIIYFWATWCFDCWENLIELEKFAHYNKKSPINIIALSQDFQNIATIKNFYDEQNIKYLNIYHDKNHEIMNYFDIKTLPTIMLIKKNNCEITKITGTIPWNDASLQKEIEQLF